MSKHTQHQDPIQTRATTITPPLSLSFRALKGRLPKEIIFHILYAWSAPQSLLVDPISNTTDQQSPGIDHEFHVEYACSTDEIVFHALVLPQYLKNEYRRYRHLLWLTSVKDFNAPYDFYMSHHLLQPHLPGDLSAYALPSPSWQALEDREDWQVKISDLLTRPHPHLRFHGLERIKLDFSAEQYFSLFRVAVPPFDFEDPIGGDDLYHDALCRGAGTFLK